MRLATPLATLALVAAGASLGAFAQERLKPKGPADFDTVHAAVAKDFHAGRYGKAYAGAKELVGLIGNERSLAIRKALPAAPEGYEKVVEKKAHNASMQNNAMLAMAAGVGNVIEQSYRGSGGQIKVTVTADSPFVQMFNMILGNPAMVGENQEVIKYGEVMALLETQGKRKTLKILIDSTLIDTTFPDHSDDFIFGMWDQKAVDAVGATIRN